MAATIAPDSIAAARASRDRMARLARERGRSNFRYLAHAALARSLGALFAMMPLDMASAFGGWVGRRLVYPLVPIRHAYETVRVPFPDMTDTEIATLLGEMFDNIGRMVAEFAHMGAFSAPGGNDRLRLTGLDNLTAARASGKGILFVSGHFANSELFKVAVRNAGFDGANVLQHPNNPYLVEWIARQRYRYGFSEQIAAGEGVLPRVRAALAAGRCVQMLADQGVTKGLVAPFFGRPVLTNAVPARAALELDVPVVPMAMRRLDGAYFEVEFLPPLALPRSGDRPADEIALMTMINQFFETQIRAEPAQWLWGHSRWVYGTISA